MTNKNMDNLIEDIILEDSDIYKVKLENFEGPLDLLLHLIKKSKLDIHEINLSSVTAQYLEYMQDLENIDMEKAADFIEVAATLIEIKSKAVLPRHEEDEEEPEDQGDLLLKRLQEYKLFKEAGEKLTEIENVDKFYKEPDKSANDYRIILKQMNMDNLISAFSNLLHKIDIEEQEIIPKTIQKDRFTVEEKAFELRTRLVKTQKMKFKDLIESDFSRSEIITIFLALLEMLKLQEIEVIQKNEFSEIEIIRSESEDSDE